MPLPPLARTQELFARSRDEIAQEDHQYCPLDQWHRDTYGLDVMEELLAARVRFLQTLNEPEMARYMNINDMGRLLSLFPDDYARLFPRAGSPE